MSASFAIGTPRQPRQGGGPHTPRKPQSGHTSGASSPMASPGTAPSEPTFEPTRFGDSTLSSSLIGAAWQVDTGSCSVCKVKFRKRDLTRRHHCRVCGFCVCGECSPNKVVVDGFRGPQRVCNPCVRVASSPREKELLDQAAQLAKRLQELQDPEQEVFRSNSGPPATVEDALHMAESALMHLEFSRGARSEAETALKEAEAVAASETQKRAELEERVLQAEAAAKLIVGAGGGAAAKSNWRSSGAASQEASFSGAPPRPDGGENDKCGCAIYSSEKCTGAACAVM